jgi:hypothetical protein
MAPSRKLGRVAAGKLRAYNGAGEESPLLRGCFYTMDSGLIS